MKKPKHTYDVLAKQVMCSCTIIRPIRVKVVTLKTGRLFEETETAYPSRAHRFTRMPFSFSCEVHVTQLFSFPCSVCLHSVSCAKC